MKYWQCKCLTFHVVTCSFRCFWFCLQLRPVLLLQHSLQSPLAEKPPPTERPSGAGAVGSSRTMRPPSLGKTLPPPHSQGTLKAPDGWTDGQADGQTERAPQLACANGPWAVGGVPRRGCRLPHALCCPSSVPVAFPVRQLCPHRPGGVEWGRVTV